MSRLLRVYARLQVTSDKSGSSGAFHVARVAGARRGHTSTMYAHRRHAALVLTLIALAAVTLFALGLTLCIDWGGASAPPRDFGRQVGLTLSLV